MCIIRKVHSHVCTDYFLKVQLVTNTNLYNAEMKENMCYVNILCDFIKQISSLSSSTNKFFSYLSTYPILRTNYFLQHVV